mmetsp:Transcript_1766/g.10895  ORF Transcript_1766/g.10895 Transcript_1766/m.10895 type:complete len:491 (-) Transcript_1766:795-2267(-)
MEGSPRKRAKKEEKNSIRHVQECWEMASLMAFLGAFADDVELPIAWTVDGLEAALLVPDENGTEVMDLHVALLRGMNPKAAVNETNWRTMVAKKIKAQSDAKEELFHKWVACKNHQERELHAQCTPIEKLKVLLIMCELRMACDNIRSRVERAATAPKKKMGEDDIHILNALRPSPLGVDAEGAKYWFMDAGNKNIDRGFRLYKEDSRNSGTKVKATPVKWWETKKASLKVNLGGSKTSIPTMEKWQLIARDEASMEKVGESLTSGNAKADRRLGAIILDSIVPGLKERKKREEKRQVAAQRLHVALGNGLNANNLEVSGRGHRVRRAVNYTFENYDKEIEESIKAQNHRGERKVSEQISPHEANRLGLRRGRSAFPVETAPEKECENDVPTSLAVGNSSMDAAQQNNFQSHLDYADTAHTVVQHDLNKDSPTAIVVSSADDGNDVDTNNSDDSSHTQTSDSEEEYIIQSQDQSQGESEEDDTSDFICSE